MKGRMEARSEFSHNSVREKPAKETLINEVDKRILSKSIEWFPDTAWHAPCANADADDLT